MNELHDWLSQQHHGLRTFRNFQEKLETLSRRDPAQRALYALLGHLVGGYVEAFDEEPLPAAVADRAYGRLLELVASLSSGAHSRDPLARNGGGTAGRTPAACFRPSHWNSLSL